LLQLNLDKKGETYTGFQNRSIRFRFGEYGGRNISPKPCSLAYSVTFPHRRVRGPVNAAINQLIASAISLPRPGGTRQIQATCDRIGECQGRIGRAW
jgi:hypothetical protein